VVANQSGAPLVLNATLQETVFEILEKVARFAGVLLYEDVNGNLLLANVGTSTMASGFTQGVNVQAASAAFTMDERYSEYLPVLMSTNMYGQQGIGGTSFPKVFDQGVPRFRPEIVVSPQFQQNQSFAETCAQWEATRRWGRANMLRVTCDSWRDKAGTLWAPNAFAPIDIPALQLKTMSAPWIIGSIDFIKDADRGTVADLMLMPQQAFSPQPVYLVPNWHNPNDGDQPPAGGGATAPGGGAAADDGSGPSGSPGLPPAGGGASH
jgi:prophage tail gpP-like protein